MGFGISIIRAISVFYKKFVSAEYVEAEVFLLPQGLVPRFFFFSSSPQLRLKFILLINVKMPTIVGILTFISRIN